MLNIVHREQISIILKIHISLKDSIKQMKELKIKAIDLDNFIKYQNGDLISSFARW